MEKKLNIGQKLDFNEIDLTAPEKVIEDILNQVSEQTRGIVTGKIEVYTGHVMSYTKSGLSSLALSLEPMTEKEVSIQESLGRIGQEIHKFECYLSTPVYEKYKYRLFFVKYEVANYPVNIILEESIARSLSTSNSGYVFRCDTREQLEELIVNIFTSQKVISVMQEIIRIHQSKKEINKKQNEKN